MNRTIYNQDNEVIEEVLDNGDDTAIKKLYEDGQFVSEETIEYNSHAGDEIEQRQEALQTIVDAKDSSNPEVAALARAVETLLNA